MNYMAHSFLPTETTVGAFTHISPVSLPNITVPCVDSYSIAGLFLLGNYNTKYKHTICSVLHLL